jgi:hypothetical protein
MKAEQRKELETNALADRMGHLVKRMKTQPRRATMYYVLGAIAIVLIGFAAVRWFQYSRDEASKRWMFFNIGTQDHLAELAQKDAETDPGKAARFEFAWYLYWELGLKRLGHGDGQAGLENMQKAAAQYDKLATMCAGDKIWEPEAMYALAVIEETHAVVNPEYLDKARVRYEELAKKYPKSARGELAEAWVKNYDNKEKKQELTQFYAEMQSQLDIRDPNAIKKMIEQLQKKLPKDNKDNKKAK